MIVKMYSVYDKKSELWKVPFYAQNAGLAIRMFTVAVRDPNTELATFAEDFELWEVGEFNNDFGVFVCYEQKHHMCNAVDLLEKRIDYDDDNKDK